VKLPVYPDGAVTVTLPLRRAGDAGPTEAVVTFGACSEQRCTSPSSTRASPSARPADPDRAGSAGRHRAEVGTAWRAAVSPGYAISAVKASIAMFRPVVPAMTSAPQP
jgi:hypothetical protein